MDESIAEESVTRVLPPDSVTVCTERMTASSAVGVEGMSPTDWPTATTSRLSPTSVNTVPLAATLNATPEPAAVGSTLGTVTSITEPIVSLNKSLKLKASRSDFCCTKGIDAVTASVVPSTS